MGYILYQLNSPSTREQFSRVSLVFTSPDTILILLLVLFMMLLNNMAEAWKWNYLVNKVQELSFRKALSAVFAGASIGVFTPNNLGEFGGRILYLEEEHRVQGVLITFLSSISQMVITITAGLLAFIPFYLYVLPQQALDPPWLIAIIFILVMLVIILFLNIHKAGDLLLRFSFFQKRSRYLVFLRGYGSPDLGYTLLLSLLKYMIFATQYALLLHIFVPGLLWSQVYMTIALIYLAQSVLPGFAITELGIRGSVAIFFFGYLTSGPGAVLLAAFSLWLINIILPALTGTYFIIKAHLFDNRL